jgi:hypothetical protein
LNARTATTFPVNLHGRVLLDQLTADEWVHGFQLVKGIQEYRHTLGKLIDSVFYFLANVRLCNG